MKRAARKGTAEQARSRTRELLCRHFGPEIALPDRLAVGRVHLIHLHDDRIELLPRTDGIDFLRTSIARWNPGHDELEVRHHARLHADGTLEALENLIGELGTPRSVSPRPGTPSSTGTCRSPSSRPGRPTGCAPTGRPDRSGSGRSDRRDR